ncbi:MAG: hypothetical protein JWR05_3475 [Mucilaginibacter sp.]|nr:hypothetical protein [Mucilaginibacter sp.]
MSTIDELYEDFAALNLRAELPNMVLQTSYEITALIVGQKELGQLSTGEKVTPSYGSNYYSTKKEQLNPLAGYGTPDGRLTGAFDAGLGVTIKGDEYNVESNVDYAQNESLTQYGPDFIRLSDENMTAYCEDTLAPVIHDYITEKTGLIFG